MKCVGKEETDLLSSAIVKLETQEIPRAEKFRMGALLAAGSKGT